MMRKKNGGGAGRILVSQSYNEGYKANGKSLKTFKKQGKDYEIQEM